MYIIRKMLWSLWQIDQWWLYLFKKKTWHYFLLQSWTFPSRHQDVLCKPDQYYHYWCLAISCCKVISSYDNDINSACILLTSLKVNLNTPRPEQNGEILADDILEAFSWKESCKFVFKFHWNLFLSSLLTLSLHWFRYGHPTYRKTSSISRTKSPSLNVSCILVQLSLQNPLKPVVKLRMKM